MINMEKLKEALKKGRSNQTRELTIKCLEEGLHPDEIIQEMLEVMEVVGVEFKRNELFIPEVLLISRAFNSALAILDPVLVKAETGKLGVVVLGTIHGDVHNIGKNLVKVMLEGVGAKVIDLGVDVSNEAFYEAILQHQPDILAVSALLTTTRVHIRSLIHFLEEKGVRQDLKILVGGAPLNEAFALEFGADYYAKDAGAASILVKQLLAG